MAREESAVLGALAGPEDLEARAERRAREARAERRAREARAEPPVKEAKAEPRVNKDSQANRDSRANQDGPAVTHQTRVARRGISDAARISSTSSVSA